MTTGNLRFSDEAEDFFLKRVSLTVDIQYSSQVFAPQPTQNLCT